jgi:non-specific serine/threonine protein kinase/serine/threonine-protein kinase
MTMATIAFDAATSQPQSADSDDFGNYQIQRVLGEGGMGTVYRAEQTAPIRRTVALKVVKSGMDSSHVLSRFAYERQALAMMDHPHIARVFDANVTRQGRPFFVMEYVDGIPITKYCDDRRLNTAERLKLFLPICEAVQHAHQKGIIHRDLKPTNVLVEEIDGRPIAKVIDFGIAKAVDQGGADDPMLTQLGQFVGTPEYMSPEQADPLNQTVDATSDVYSLGVMLYELLVGAVPFDSSTMRKGGLAEILRVIREDEAPTLHSRLTGLGHTAAEIAQMRGTGLLALRKELAGDLNWIAMKAVEKERQRRYATAADLAADIHRYLENRPVLASPPSRRYRARKFVRRNRLPVLAASVAAAALIVGFAAAIWQARIARRERSVAVEQRSIAEAQRSIAEAQRSIAEAQRSVAEARGREAAIQKQHAEEEAANAHRQQEAAERQRAIAESRLDDVSALANSMLFEVDDRVRELPGAMPAREVLMQRGLDYLNRMSAETPDSARLRRQLGGAYLKMGELQWDPDGSNLRDLHGARESYARSSTLLEAQVQANPNDAALRHQLTLAYLRHAQLLDSDREQRAGFERALQSARQLTAAQPASLQAQDDLAEVYLAQQEFARAVDIRKQILAADSKSADARFKLYSAQSMLGGSLVQKEDDQALDILTAALAGLDALHAEDSTNVHYQRYRGVVLSYLGVELMLHNRFADAVARSRDAVAIQTELAAADTRNAGFRRDLSSAESRLGTVLVNGGQNAEGMQHLQKALAVQEEEALAHPENSDFALAAALLHNQIAALSGTSSDRAATLKHRQAAASLYRTLAHDHPGRALFAMSLAAELTAVGDAQLQAGDRASAMDTYREAVKAADSLGVGGQPTDEEWTVKANAHASLARGASALNRIDESIAEDRLAIADYQRVSPGSAASKAVRNALALAWSHLSAGYTARSDYRSALDASLKSLPYAEADYADAPNSFAVARSLWNNLVTVRNCYISLGDFTRAVDTARRGVDIAEKLTALQPLDLNRIALLSFSYTNLASTLRSVGRRDESLANYRRAAAVLDGKPIENLDTAPVKRDWADHYLFAARGLLLWGEPREALPICRRMIPVLESLHRADAKNEAYRAELVTAYRAAESAFIDSGLLAEGLQTSQKILQVESANPRQDAAFWLNQGLTQAKIGSLQARDGDAATAQASWRAALDLFEKGRSNAAKIHSEHGDDRTALALLALAESRLAFIQELLGDRAEARRRIQDAIVHQSALADSDSSKQSWAHQLRDYRAESARLDSFIGGAQTAHSPQDLARGWAQYAGQLAEIAYPLPARIEADQKAVDLASADAQPASQLELAEAFTQLGHDRFETARSTQGAEYSNALHSAEQSYAEARRILTTLQQAGPLPENSRSTLSDAVNSLATIAAKLAETTVAIR